MANYYVSSAGNDSNAGTSTGSPWLTLTKASTATLSSDDTLSLNRGDTFSGTLNYSAQVGASGHPIVIGAYGSGAKPIISCGNQRAVYLQNCSYVTVQDINAVGVGVVPSTGLMADGSTFWLYAYDIESTLSVGTLAGIRILRCQSTGVFGGTFVHCDAATTPVGFNGVEIGGTASDPYLCYEALGMGIYIYGSEAASSSGSPYFLAKGRDQHRNVWVHDFIVHNVYGVPSASYTTNNFTGSPVVVSNATTGLVESGLTYTSGHKNDDARGGPVGIMTIETDGVIIQTSEVYDQRSSAVDGTGIDMDGGSLNGIVQRCYVHDNHASPFACGTFTGSNSCDSNKWLFNICENNGGTSTIHTFNNATNIVVAQNTFYHVPSGDYAVLNSYGETWTYLNNIALTTGGTKVLGSANGTGGGTDVFQGDLYWSLSASPFWTDNTHTMPGLNPFTTLTGFRSSVVLVVPPETQSGDPVGQYGNPDLPDVGSGGTIGSIGNMNALMVAYDPPNGSLANAGGVTDVRINGLADFHGNMLASGAAQPVGAVYYNNSSGPIFLVTRVR